MLDNYPTTKAQLAAIQELHPNLMPDVIFCLRDSEGEGEVEILADTHILVVIHYLFQLYMFSFIVSNFKYLLLILFMCMVYN